MRESSNTDTFEGRLSHIGFPGHLATRSGCSDGGTYIVLRKAPKSMAPSELSRDGKTIVASAEAMVAPFKEWEQLRIL